MDTRDRSFEESRKKTAADWAAGKMLTPWQQQLFCHEVAESYPNRRPAMTREQIETTLAQRSSGIEELLRLADAVRALQCAQVWDFAHTAMNYQQARLEHAIRQTAHRQAMERIAQMPDGDEKQRAFRQQVAAGRALRRQFQTRSRTPYKHALTSHLQKLSELDALRGRIGYEVAALQRDVVYGPRTPGTDRRVYFYVDADGRTVARANALLHISGHGFRYCYRDEPYLLVPVHATSDAAWRWPLLEQQPKQGCFLWSGPQTYSDQAAVFLRSDLQWDGWQNSLCKPDSYGLLVLRLTKNAAGRFAFGQWGAQGFELLRLAFDLQEMQLTEVEDIEALVGQTEPPDGLFE